MTVFSPGLSEGSIGISGFFSVSVFDGSVVVPSVLPEEHATTKKHIITANARHRNFFISNFLSAKKVFSHNKTTIAARYFKISLQKQVYHKRLPFSSPLLFFEKKPSFLREEKKAKDALVIGLIILYNFIKKADTLLLFRLCFEKKSTAKEALVIGFTKAL